MPGLTFRDARPNSEDPRFASCIDLNSLPLPDYSLFPSIELFDFIPIDVGRGCPFSAPIVFPTRWLKERFRQRSVESVIKIVKTVSCRFQSEKASVRA